MPCESDPAWNDSSHAQLDKNCGGQAAALTARSLQVSSILKAVVHKVEDAALGLFPSRLKKKETNGKSRRVHDSNSHCMSYFGGKKPDWDSMWKFESINIMHE